MSATVTYKNSPIFDISRTTKKLTTSGQWMEDDLYVSSTYDIIGDKAEKVRDVYSVDLALADTGFATWTPATSATAIVASVNCTTEVLAMANYDYFLKWYGDFQPVLQSGATTKAQLIRECAILRQYITRRPHNYANLNLGNFSGNGATTFTASPLMVYYTTSGAQSMTYSISYGIYPAAVAPTFSNSTSLTPTLTIKTPTYNARCYSSYFAVARAPELDQDNSYIHLRGELWRIPKPSPMTEMYEDIVDLYLNPLQGD